VAGSPSNVRRHPLSGCHSKNFGGETMNRSIKLAWLALLVCIPAAANAE
jgi:hypothetical protein